ncbi:cupin domain-containing protein [Halobaculum litoreum]|uniref:cupin domain-containing protein n=1 Tax=Halobaculum litoreum TaxID=3031998 RepID=UPI0024C41A88|nr:cupin domain-containing protein [Halobaculum sp. DT92]
MLSDELDTDGVSVNHYTLDPGESFRVSTHRHGVQEEIFYIVSGAVTFGSDAAETTVEAGELVRIPPGTSQLGTNDGDTPATGLAIGAPREYEEETEWLVECPDCDERTVHTFGEAATEGEYRYECTGCGHETYRVSA